MNIFISYKSSDYKSFDKIQRWLNEEENHNSYVIPLKNKCPSGLHDLDALNDILKEEDLALVLLSKDYLLDTWLNGELRALLALQNDHRPNFVVCLLLEDFKEPYRSFKKEIGRCVDFRKIKFKKAFIELRNCLNTLNIDNKTSVFISHSHADKKIASAFTDLLYKAFRINSKNITCTSIPSSSLPLNTIINAGVKRKIREAKVFICILTTNSINSFYVLVELGLRWGMRDVKKGFGILTVGDVFDKLLGSPFNDRKILSCQDRIQVEQFLNDIKDEIGVELEITTSYSLEIDKLIEAANNTP